MKNEQQCPVTGKMKLVDGRTGEYFDNEIVVGESYILKLVHMSEDKMHTQDVGAMLQAVNSSIDPAKSSSRAVRS